MNTRRSFLKFLGLAPAIAAVAKLPITESAVAYNQISPGATASLYRGVAMTWSQQAPTICCEVGDCWLDTTTPDYAMRRFDGEQWVPVDVA